MDLADVAGAVEAEIIVGGQEIAADDLADDRGQPPEEEQHRLVEMAIGLEGRPVEQVHVLGDPC